MTWGTAFLITGGWIVGFILLIIILSYLDKVFHFYDHSGWSDLGRLIMQVIFLFTVPVIFLITIFFIKLSNFNMTLYIIVIVTLVLAYPVYCVVKRIRFSPDRMVNYCCKKTGPFDSFHDEYLKTHKGEGYLAPTEHEIIAQYITEELNCIYKGLRFAYYPMKLSTRNAYVKAVLKEAKTSFELISKWEIIEDIYPELRFRKQIVIDYKDGGNSIISVNYRLTHDKMIAWLLNEKSLEEREILSIRKSFDSINITGRLCYTFLCVEKYLMTLYPEADWKGAAYMWRITEKNGFGWSEWNETVLRNCVSTLVEYMDRPEKSFTSKEKKARTNDIMNLVLCIRKLGDTVAKHSDSFYAAEDLSINTIRVVKRHLEKYDVEAPDPGMVASFGFDRRTITDKGENEEGWGYDVNTERFSEILKKANAEENAKENKRMHQQTIILRRRNMPGTAMNSATGEANEKTADAATDASGETLNAAAGSDGNTANAATETAGKK